MYVVTPDGKQKEYKPANGKKLELKELQKLVAGGGYIETVHPRRHPDTVMVVDEDGWRKNLLRNEHASKLYGGTIVGTVLVMTRAEYKKYMQ